MSRHQVDPSRGGKDDPYRDGYRDGRRDTRRGLSAAQQAAAQQHFGGGGGMPPRRRGCPLTALVLLALLPLMPLLAASGWRLGRRHVPEDQREQDRNERLEPERKITADLADDEVDGYPLGTRTGLPRGEKR